MSTSRRHPFTFLLAGALIWAASSSALAQRTSTPRARASVVPQHAPLPDDATSQEGASAAQGEAFDPAFVEVAQDLGLDYLQSDLTVPLGNSDVYLTGGAAIGDVDDDGWVDVYATRFDDHDLLFHNAGTASGTHLGFTDVTAGSFETLPGTGKTNGPLFVDLDNDGDLDLYVTSLESLAYELWMNDGTGSFTEDAASRGADLASTNLHNGMSATAGDYDRDGWLDLYVAEWGNSFVSPGVINSHSRLLHNTGGGYFEDTTDDARVAIEGLSASGPIGTFTGVFAFSPSFTDLDRDGFPDLAIASDFLTSRLFWNRGNGAFLDGTEDAGVGTDENGMGSAIGDYDGDGDLDWFISSIWDPDGICAMTGCNWAESGNRLYQNNGDRTFTDATDEAGVRDGAWGWGSSFFDYDNDGDLDLAHTNGIDFPFTSVDGPYEHDQTRFFVNRGDGTFDEHATALGVTDTGSGKALCTFDYDNDGDLDLLIVQNGDRPLLYENLVGNRNDWLRVELRGSVSNHFGIGAWVTVTPVPGATPLVRELRCGSNYLSQDENALFFGLGRSADRVASIEVDWPSGQRTVLTNVTRNQRLVIQEPAVAPPASKPDAGMPARRKALRR